MSQNIVVSSPERLNNTQYLRTGTRKGSTRVQIRVNGHTVNFGEYDTHAEAVLVRDLILFSLGRLDFQSSWGADNDENMADTYDKYDDVLLKADNARMRSSAETKAEQREGEFKQLISLINDLRQEVNSLRALIMSHNATEARHITLPESTRPDPD